MEGGDDILKILASPLRRILDRAPVSFWNMQELRLRSGRPFLCRYGGREYGFTEDGRLEHAEKSTVHIVTAGEVKETLEYAGNYSLYAYEEEFRQGFLTVRGGHRIGLAGKTSAGRGEVKALRHVSFLNIRLAHQILGCANQALPYLWEGGRVCNTLLISPPGCGKTTLLRDLIRQISDGSRGHPGITVGVVDERSELAACCQGVPQNDVGIRTDVLDGCPKAAGLSMLIRTMSPEAAAVDEIGGREDLAAVREAGQCGCSILASAHGASLEEIRRKPGFSELFTEGFFSRYLLLGRSEKQGAGTVLGIYDGTGVPIYEPGIPIGKPKIPIQEPEAPGGEAGVTLHKTGSG